MRTPPIWTTTQEQQNDIMAFVSCHLLVGVRGPNGRQMFGNRPQAGTTTTATWQGQGPDATNGKPETADGKTLQRRKKKQREGAHANERSAKKKKVSLPRRQQQYRAAEGSFATEVHIASAAHNGLSGHGVGKPRKPLQTMTR